MVEDFFQLWFFSGALSTNYQQIIHKNIVWQTFIILIYSWKRHFSCVKNTGTPHFNSFHTLIGLKPNGLKCQYEIPKCKPNILRLLPLKLSNSFRIPLKFFTLHCTIQHTKHSYFMDSMHIENHFKLTFILLEFYLDKTNIQIRVFHVFQSNSSFNLKKIIQ